MRNFASATSTTPKRERSTPIGFGLVMQVPQRTCDMFGKGSHTQKKRRGATSFAGDGHQADIAHKGEWKGTKFNIGKEQKQLNKAQRVQMSDILFIPTLRHNLFSITKAMAEEGDVSNEDDVIVVKFKNKMIKFD